jgi:hypothetical protein
MERGGGQEVQHGVGYPGEVGRAHDAVRAIIGQRCEEISVRVPKQR